MLAFTLLGRKILSGVVASGKKSAFFWKKTIRNFLAWSKCVPVLEPARPAPDKGGTPRSLSSVSPRPPPPPPPPPWTSSPAVSERTESYRAVDAMCTRGEGAGHPLVRRRRIGEL
ncbi:hypothetical protein EJB05_09076, partial [Eragrostis curvula]